VLHEAKPHDSERHMGDREWGVMSCFIIHKVDKRQKDEIHIDRTRTIHRTTNSAENCQDHNKYMQERQNTVRWLLRAGLLFASSTHRL